MKGEVFCPELQSSFVDESGPDQVSGSQLGSKFDIFCALQLLPSEQSSVSCHPPTAPSKSLLDSNCRQLSASGSLGNFVHITVPALERGTGSPRTAQKDVFD